MKVASLSSSGICRLLWNEYLAQVGIASMCFGAICGGEIEKSQSETDPSRGKQAASAGSCALTNKTAVPAAASLINFDRWLSWLPGTFIKEDRSCRMSSFPEWLWLVADYKENRAHNHLSCRGKVTVHLNDFCLFKKAKYLFIGFYTIAAPVFLISYLVQKMDP